MADKYANRELARTLRAGSQRGQAIIMVTIGIAFLMGILGLVVDVGWGYYQKQVAQAAADSAALAAVAAAGTGTITCGSGGVVCQSATSCSSAASGSNLKAGCQYAAANGVGSANMKMAANTTSPFNGAAVDYWVTATASVPMGLTFLRVLGFNSATVNASATGALIGGAGGGCIYVLDPSAGSAMTVSGSGNVYSDCGIYVNSSSSKAFVSSGGAKTTASVVDVVGGVNISGGSTVTPTPTTGVTPAKDPLANLAEPTFSTSACTIDGVGTNCYLNKNIGASSCGSGACTLSPGIYSGGITISGGANVIFGAGTYILNGGGLTVSGDSTITGNGVFFYNTSSGYAYGPIQISGDAGVTLIAPTSGTYQGILFFQDRSITSSSANTISGGSNADISGSVYLPTASLYFSGGSSTAPLTMAFVVKDLNVSGDAYLAKDPTGALTGMGSQSVALVQ